MHPFAPELMAALDEAGVEPEVFLPEYGRDQFEVSCAPAIGEASADRAVAVREITREIAEHERTGSDLRAEDQRRRGSGTASIFTCRSATRTASDAVRRRPRHPRTFFDSVDHAARAECGLRRGRKPWLNPIKSAS